MWTAKIRIGAVLGALCCAGLLACQSSPKRHVTVYSGRSEILVQPILTGFQESSGIEVEVRYGGSAELAALLTEEGATSPADVYFGQDAGALGSLARAHTLSALPGELLRRVPERFRSRDGRWVGTSGRARVLAYATARITDAELPDSVFGLSEPRFRGRVGWAPSNGSFQAFVTAMRLLDGDDATGVWLSEMVDNETKSYRDNTPLLEALLRGDIDVALTNHYYLFRFLEAEEEPAVRNYTPRAGGAGALVNIAGVGIVQSSRNRDAAVELVDYLLGPEAQRYFAEATFEYPLVDGIETHPLLQPLSELAMPSVDLSDLDDVHRTLELLKRVGAL